jgi:hypothetical protein
MIIKYFDSIVLDIPLPKEYVGNKLGQMKLEHEIKEGYFVNLKVYGFINKYDYKS